MNRTHSILVLFLLLVSGCTSSGRREEKAAPVHRVAKTRAAIADLRPPTEAEVADALRRVFDGAIVVDRSANTRFLAADFNGDYSPDLAVMVRPRSGSLKAVNSELANWVVVDPHNAGESLSFVVGGQRCRRQGPKLRERHRAL